MKRYIVIGRMGGRPYVIRQFDSFEKATEFALHCVARARPNFRAHVFEQWGTYKFQGTKPTKHQLASR